MRDVEMFLGVGFSILGLAYLGVLLFFQEAPYGGSSRRPYVMNGVALCILGISLIGRALFLPSPAVYAMWAAAGYLAIQANREIRARRGG